MQREELDAMIQARRLEGERYGPRWKDPEALADVRAQLQRGSFRYVGKNPANSENP